MEPQLVEMQRTRFGVFPRTFKWQGEVHEITTIVRAWTEGTRKSFFRVRFGDGWKWATLFQDLGSNTWHIQDYREDRPDWAQPPNSVRDPRIKEK